MYDIFKNYGLSQVDDKTSLKRTNETLECEFDNDKYRKLLIQQDKEIETLQSRYTNAQPDESLDSILHDLGYTYDLSDELMYYKYSGDYTLFIDLEEYEFGDDNYIIYGVLDCERKIPRGYCASKYKLEEPKLDEDDCDTTIGTHTRVNKDFMNSALESKYDL